jgi:hypothetical protein
MLLPVVLLASAGWIATENRLACAGDFEGHDISYSQGVHLYFAGNWDDSERYLTQAIELSPEDPRPYYFRAMIRLQSGEADLARSDMASGAKWEARRPGRYDVGFALQRVQGQGRLMLESYRREARIAQSRRQHEYAQMRYEDLERRESELQRQKADVRLDELVDPAVAKQLVTSPIQASSDQSSESSPFESNDQFQNDPFADDPVPTESASASEDSSANEKMSSGEVLGVLGRAVQKTLPIPDWRKATGMPPGPPPQDADDASRGADSPTNDFDFQEDAELPSPSTPPQNSSPEAENSSNDNSDEDLFEGF